MRDIREHVAFAYFRFDLLRRSARFRTLHFHCEQLLVGPVVVVTQLEGEMPAS